MDYNVNDVYDVMLRRFTRSVDAQTLSDAALELADRLKTVQRRVNDVNSQLVHGVLPDVALGQLIDRWVEETYSAAQLVLDDILDSIDPYNDDPNCADACDRILAELRADENQAPLRWHFHELIDDVMLQRKARATR